MHKQLSIKFLDYSLLNIFRLENLRDSFSEQKQVWKTLKWKPLESSDLIYRLYPCNFLIGSMAAYIFFYFLFI